MTQGGLTLSHIRCLGPNPELTLRAGATLELKFEGQMIVRKLSPDGKLQAPGVYGEAQCPKVISGTGTLKVRPNKVSAPA